MRVRAFTATKWKIRTICKRAGNSERELNRNNRARPETTGRCWKMSEITRDGAREMWVMFQKHKGSKLVLANRARLIRFI